MAKSEQPPVFYINLERSAARRRHMEKTLKDMATKATRNAAVDGHDLSETQVRAFNPVSGERPLLSASEVGCFLSHRRVWQEILNGSDEWAFVLEDDIGFSDDAKDFLNTTDWLPKEPGLVRIEGFVARKVLLGNRRRWLNQRRYLSRIHSASLGTAGYAIHRDVAKRLLGFTTACTRSCDRAIMDPQFTKTCRIRYWQLSPGICVQQKKSPQTRFLPGDAELTIIGDEWSENGRKEKLPVKRRGWAKIRRELTRPFERLSDLFVVFRYQSRWTIVGFEK